MFRLLRSIRLQGVLLVAGLSLVLAPRADALQFTPNGNEMLHTITSGQPGAAWTTSGLGVGGQVSYNSGTGVATLTGVLDVLNYFDTTPGSGCETDAGSTCSLNFAPDLDITLDLAFVGYSATFVAGTTYEVHLDFETLGGASDLSVLDPTDLGAGNLVTASWVAGTFNSAYTPGLTVKYFYDAATQTAVTTPTALGFLLVDPGSPYASLFGSSGDLIGLNVGSLFGYNPSLGAITASTITNGTLPSFTSEGQGQVFRVASGDFIIPEPGSLGLLGAALGGLVFVGRRRR